MKPALVLLACIVALFTGPASAQAIRAENFGIAVGGNVSNSTIISGVAPEKIDELVRERLRPYEHLSESQRETIGLLREKLDLNQRQMYASLAILGEAAVPPEQLAAKLIEMAERLKELRNVAVVAPGEDPEAAAFKRKAQDAIEAGELSLADSLLVKAEERQRRTLQTAAVNVAHTLSQRGRIALTRLHYLDAARLFGEAAALLPAGTEYDASRHEYLEAKGNALYSEGNDRGDPGAAAAAVAIFRELHSNNRDPAKRVDLALALARSLLNLTYREGNLKHLRDALDVMALARANLPSSGSQSIMVRQQMVILLLGLGIAEQNAVMLSTAVDMLRSLVGEPEIRDNRTRSTEVQSALAFSLAALGGAKSDARLLVEAADTMRAALPKFDPQNQPIDWSRANAFLAVILYGLAVQTNETDLLTQSSSYFEAALTATSPERLPLEWSIVQASYAMTLQRLGQKTKNTSTLERAVEAVRTAHKFMNAVNAPGDWAQSNHTMGHAFLGLGEITGNRAHYTSAAIAFEAALAMRQAVPHSLDWTEVVEQRDRARQLERPGPSRAAPPAGPAAKKAQSQKKTGARE